MMMSSLLALFDRASAHAAATQTESRAITKVRAERRKYHRREPGKDVRRRHVYRAYCFYRRTAELACTNKQIGYRIKPAATQNGFMRARAISTCSALLSVALLTAWPKSLLALKFEVTKRD